MKLTIKLTFATSLLLASVTHTLAYDLRINTPIKSYLKCEIEYQNTSNNVKFESCANAAFNEYDVLIKSIREEGGYKNKSQWDSSNKKLIKFKEICEKNATKTQKNSTIQKDIASCQNFFYRSLAITASDLN